MSSEQQELLALLEEKERRRKVFMLEPILIEGKFLGNFKREQYPTHVEIMQDSGKYMQRAFIAGNRVGKTFAGGIELTFHLTGRYPDWYTGRRFDRPIQAWVAAVSAAQLQTSIQEWLFGPNREEFGTGLIPKADLLDKDGKAMLWNMPGVPNCIGSALITHQSGKGYSKVEFKTYEQGWLKFQGAQRDFIWLDEDPGPTDEKIYSECITRLVGKAGEEAGMLLCTFTPLGGLTQTVQSFMPSGIKPPNGVSTDGYKKMYSVTMDDVPHLSQETKDKLMAGYSPHEIECRRNGLPYFGSGAVFAYSSDEFTYNPLEKKIEPYFPKGYGMDVGWKSTAAVFGCVDPDTSVIYIYDEYKRGKEVPKIHAANIMSRGSWLVGAIDPRSNTPGQGDGKGLLDQYRDEGLDLVQADAKDKESNILKARQMIESGTLKISRSCTELLAEMRMYRRDDSGKIVKENDHLIDAFLYFIKTGIDYMELPPDPDAKDKFQNLYDRLGKGRSKVTGY